MLSRIRILPLALLAFLPGPVSGQSIDFARQVLPILSDKCFACHGPDTHSKSELRLDSAAAATLDLGGRRAIDPENLHGSELLKRILSADDPMPPTDAEKQLTDGERDILRAWVLQGGRYARHWAFVPPVRPPGMDIDDHVQRRLQAAGFAFAPEAERATLARRVALTLTGLPLAPKRLREFMADTRDGAYERLVDDLLASPDYGEHQARYWLDAVRYGDTHGLHLDNRRGIYPYRDWVVRAFNRNLPLDQFITWQIAGDLLPDPTPEQLIATGYVRLNPSTGEGGAIAEEFQAKNSFDRVENLGTAMLGMSLVCARCHTHKYDPVTQTEYYRLMAFFNSTAEPALDGNAYQYGPVLRVPRNQGDWAAWTKVQRQRTRLLKSLDAESKQRLAVHAAVAGTLKVRDWRITGNLAADAGLPPAKEWRDVRDLPGQSGEKLPKPPQVRWVSFTLESATNQTVWLSFDCGPGHRVELDGREVASPERAVALRLTNGTHEVSIRLPGSVDRLPVTVGLTTPWNHLLAKKSWAECGEEERLLLLADPDGPLAGEAWREDAGRLATRAAALQARFTTTLIAAELKEPRPTRLLLRGEYDLPAGEPLSPGVLQLAGVTLDSAPADRRDLARWLTAPEQPLVGRVLINRVWQRVFGEGLVRTPEDFGRQGEQPTHPALLDWLAVELRESGWDLKHMIRLMVTSRAFRQSSRWRPGMDDAQNRLLGRGPTYRLDAEVIRDIGLWAGGLLQRERGGEGVKPVQPAGMWRALTHPASNTVEYEPDTDERVYRRSLYLYWKRTSPHPTMSLFDAPSRETSCVRRSRSNTPVQSLSLFNETQRLEMARGLAGRLLKRNNDPARLDLLFTLLAGRGPNPVEREACVRLLAAMRERYAAAPDDARALLSVGAAPVKEAGGELAAWAQVAATVLASDATILMY